MSAKMFFLSTFGGIKNTSKYEAEQEKLENDYQEFVTVQKSDELKSFLELEGFIKSESFLKTKKELTELRFKGSPEEAQLKEYDKLHKNKKLAKYYLTSGSSELKKYYAIKESEKLKQYNELKSFMEDGSFKSEKEKYAKELFKGSSEEAKTKELQKLQKNKKLKDFFALKDSNELEALNKFEGSDLNKKGAELEKKGQLNKDEKKELKQLKSDSNYIKNVKFKKSKAYRNYTEISKTDLPVKHEKLSSEVNSEAFKNRVAYLKDKQKFEKTEVFNKSQEYKKLATSDDIRFYFKYPKSSAYKNYQNLDQSEIRKRYEELKTTVESEEYLKRKAYLEDDKKWEKTDEYQKEQLYIEMMKRPHLVKYMSYVDTNLLDFYKDWEIVFEDRFKDHQLDKSKWQTLSPWAEKTVGRNFSHTGDLQGFTDGENIKMKHGNLQIHVYNERTKSLVWNAPTGFNEEELHYSSGLVSTGHNFQAEYGIVEAKIKYEPLKELVDVVYLGNENETGRVNLLEAGAVNRVGLINGNTEESESINGLSKNKFYIFRLEWEKGKLTWKINGKEVFETKSNVPEAPLHINLASLVIKKTNKLPHRFTVDWIRFYQKKS